MFSRAIFRNFTAFVDLDIRFCDGINVLLGANGTGKTHIMKALYAVCGPVENKRHYAEKLCGVFFPADKQIGRLANRRSGSVNASLRIYRKNGLPADPRILLKFSNHTVAAEKTQVTLAGKAWSKNPVQAVYIPVKDMLANAPGFPALYKTREIHFEEIYADIIEAASLPFLKGPPDQERREVVDLLQKAMDGKVIVRNGRFYHKSAQGELEFTLLAEGFRKVGLLWALLQNGALLKGSVLFWDEPEANLNPKMARAVTQVLFALRRMGVQVFVATHDYMWLKEIDLNDSGGGNVKYHAMYRDAKTQGIRTRPADRLADVDPNAIDEAYGDLLSRMLGRQGKE